MALPEFAAMAGVPVRGLCPDGGDLGVQRQETLKAWVLLLSDAGKSSPGSWLISCRHGAPRSVQRVETHRWVRHVPSKRFLIPLQNVLGQPLLV